MGWLLKLLLRAGPGLVVKEVTAETGKNLDCNAIQAYHNNKLRKERKMPDHAFVPLNSLLFPKDDSYRGFMVALVVTFGEVFAWPAATSDPHYSPVQPRFIVPIGT